MIDQVLGEQEALALTLILGEHREALALTSLPVSLIPRPVDGLRVELGSSRTRPFRQGVLLHHGLHDMQPHGHEWE